MNPMIEIEQIRFIDRESADFLLNNREYILSNVEILECNKCGCPYPHFIEFTWSGKRSEITCIIPNYEYRPDSIHRWRLAELPTSLHKNCVPDGEEWNLLPIEKLRCEKFMSALRTFFVVNE
jgi:hypothetical protein